MDPAFAPSRISAASFQARGARGSAPVCAPTRRRSYRDSCIATITWDDGDVVRVNVGAVFTSADVGVLILRELLRFRRRELVAAGE